MNSWTNGFGKRIAIQAMFIFCLEPQLIVNRRTVNTGEIFRICQRLDRKYLFGSRKCFYSSLAECFTSHWQHDGKIVNILCFQLDIFTLLLLKFPPPSHNSTDYKCIRSPLVEAGPSGRDRKMYLSFLYLIFLFYLYSIDLSIINGRAIKNRKVNVGRI